MATEDPNIEETSKGSDTPAAEQSTPPPPNGGENNFFDQLSNAAAHTPKQSFGPEVEEGEQPGGTDSPEEENANDGNPGGSSSGPSNGWSQDRIEAEATMHVVFFDFAASRSLAMYSGDPAENFAASENEKKDLSRALADWYKTMEAPPKMPPWIMVAFMVVVVYGPKVAVARAANIAKKKAKKAKAPGTVSVEKNAPRPQAQPGSNAEEIPFTVVKNENDGQAKPQQ